MVKTMGNDERYLICTDEEGKTVVFTFTCYNALLDHVREHSTVYEHYSSMTIAKATTDLSFKLTETPLD
jgi:hypothetical protein